MNQWWAFDLVPNSKHPLVEWRDHHNQRPFLFGEHVGLDCGRSGLVVVDCDVDKETREPKGFFEFRRLCAWHNDKDAFLHTYKVGTPSGGTHFYYVAPMAAVIHNSAGKTRKTPNMLHVDVRANGGFVVAPGAVVGGKHYLVLNTTHPRPLPAWLTEALWRRPAPAVRPAVYRPDRGHGYAEAALAGEAQLVADTTEGGRNEQLWQSAFTLSRLIAGGAIESARVIDVLAAAARATGLDDKEIVDTLRKALGTRMSKQTPQVRGRACLRQSSRWLDG